MSKQRYRYTYDSSMRQNNADNNATDQHVIIPYSVTISPPVRGMNDAKQCRADMWVMRYIHRYSHRYIIIPELSPSMRLHYHGVIHSSRYHMLRYIKPHLSKKLGFMRVTQLKTPVDYLRYLTYCKKEWHDNKYIFDDILTPLTRRSWVRRYRRTDSTAKILKDYAKNKHQSTDLE